jgi:hypothetical protein
MNHSTFTKDDFVVPNGRFSRPVVAIPDREDLENEGDGGCSKTVAYRQPSASEASLVSPFSGTQQTSILKVGLVLMWDIHPFLSLGISISE